MVRIVECVPNFSEGRNLQIIDQITAEIKKVKGVKLLDVDPGYDTNRTVVTFVGDPDSVQEAAFNAVKKSHELIDMSKHKGAHPRFGACDVCPIIPVSGVTMDDCVEIARNLGTRLGNELDFPVYFYENAASSPERQNLAKVRAGEYEALEERLKDDKWRPDAGPAEFKPTKGATAVGAREFLIAYNVNLNTVNPRKATYLANRIKEQGYPKRDEKGAIVKDEHGKKVMMPGKFKNCKAIGWYVDDYKRAQVSINLTNYNVTSMHHVFDELSALAEKRGMRVTGSEIVGVVPKKSLLDAGIHYLKKQNMCTGQSEEELIKIAAFSLGLSDVAPFRPEEKVIEYMIKEEGKLVDLTVRDFNNLLASDAPAPGGGSVAALCGSLSASLGAMVANLTFNKKGYKQYNDDMDRVAHEMQLKKEELLRLIDEDTHAFNVMMDASIAKNKAKKSGDEELLKSAEKAEYDAACFATKVPLTVMKEVYSLLDNLKTVAEKGNVNAASDAGVGALLVQSGVKAAGLNVKINLQSFTKDDTFHGEMTAEMNAILTDVDSKAQEIIDIVNSKIS